MQNIEVKEEVKFNTSNSAKQPTKHRFEIDEETNLPSLEVKGGPAYEEEYKGTFCILTLFHVFTVCMLTQL
jgi:hypothetical protein